MTDMFLEFNDACMENTGYLNPGRIKLSDQAVVFKNTKSGRMEQIQAGDIGRCQWTRLGGKPAVKLVTKNGTLYRFGGFVDTDYDKLKIFMKRNYSLDLEQVETSVRGWNYGKAKFDGNSMEFEVENQPCFEIPLQNVSNCTPGKNEVAVEFHQNDDCAVSLVEMRFHVPTSENPQSEDAVEEFRRKIMKYAGIIQETGKALAVLDQILCTTPRGRYDIKLYPTFLALHGKTFDYKIPISTILRLFLLPHRDGRRMFFVISLDPPIKQGQTRYHFLICEFAKDEEIDLELGLAEDVLKEKFEGQLQKQMKGMLYEVVSRIMKTLVKKKITVPGSFIGFGLHSSRDKKLLIHSATSAVSCAYKSAAGFLYPLEKGFMFIHKPPMHIRQEEIACINFARSDVSTRTFDFEIETKNGNSFTFTSIEKEEYGKLFDYVNSKKLRIKNVGKKMESSTKENFFEGSDEDETDHYAEKLKKDAREKEEEEEEDESSEDSDYNPENEKKGSEPDEEFDSDAASSDGSSAGSDQSGGGTKKVEKPKTMEKAKNITTSKKPEKKSNDDKDKNETSGSDDDGDVSMASSSSGKKKPPQAPKPKAKPSKAPPTSLGKKRESKKKAKDPNQPKKNQSSYMLWLSETREQIKKPGMAVTDVVRKAGEMWRELKDKSKWEKLAADDKKRYVREMDEFKKSGGASSTGSKSMPSKNKPSPKKSPVKGISDEFVATDEDTSSDDDVAKKPAKSDEDEASDTPSSGDSKANSD